MFGWVLEKTETVNLEKLQQWIMVSQDIWQKWGSLSNWLAPEDGRQQQHVSRMLLLDLVKMLRDTGFFCI